MRRLLAVSAVTGMALSLGACSSGGGSNDTNASDVTQPAKPTSLEYTDKVAYELNEAGFKKVGKVMSGFYSQRDLAQNWATPAGEEQIELMFLDNGWGDGGFVERLTYKEDFTVPGKGKFDSFRCTQQALKGAYDPEALMLITEALRLRLVDGSARLTYSKTRKVNILRLEDTVGVICFAFGDK